MIVGMLYVCTIQRATSHSWVSNWNVANVTEELNFKFYLILIHLSFNLTSCMGAPILDSEVLEFLPAPW